MSVSGVDCKEDSIALFTNKLYCNLETVKLDKKKLFESGG
ncbi:MAG: hypothetical protein K0R19_673 [Bacillota bacterium]|nr:hypothetical protein [Bacillota bacterium]